MVQGYSLGPVEIFCENLNFSIFATADFFRIWNFTELHNFWSTLNLWSLSEIYRENKKCPDGRTDERTHGNRNSPLRTTPLIITCMRWLFMIACWYTPTRMNWITFSNFSTQEICVFYTERPIFGPPNPKKSPGSSRRGRAAPRLAGRSMHH